MNPIQAKLKIYTYSLAALSLLSAILYLLSYRLAFDSALHYFSATSPLPTIARAVLVLSLLWAVSALIFLPKGTMRPITAPYSIGTVFAAALCAFILLFFSGRDLYALLRDSVYFFTTRDKVIYLIGTVAGLLSAIYFFAALAPANHPRIWHQLLGFCPILWAFSSMAGLYFDFTHPMNEPGKVSVMLALIAAMLALLEGLRMTFGRSRPRWVLVSHYLASLLCAVGGLAGLLSYAFIAPLGDYFTCFTIITAFALFFLFRSFDLMRAQLTPAPQEESECAE